MIPYEEEYEERLSLLKLEELSIHIDILCLKYIAKVRDYDDHPCKKFLKDQSTEHHLWTAIFFIKYT